MNFNLNLPALLHLARTNGEESYWTAIPLADDGGPLF